MKANRIVLEESDAGVAPAAKQPSHFACAAVFMVNDEATWRFGAWVDCPLYRTAYCALMILVLGHGFVLLNSDVEFSKEMIGQFATLTFFSCPKLAGDNSNAGDAASLAAFATVATDKVEISHRFHDATIAAAPFGLFWFWWMLLLVSGHTCGVPAAAANVTNMRGFTVVVERGKSSTGLCSPHFLHRLLGRSVELPCITFPFVVVPGPAADNSAARFC